MRFGLFCSPKADSGNLGPETGQGFRDYLDFNAGAVATIGLAERKAQLIVRE